MVDALLDNTRDTIHVYLANPDGYAAVKAIIEKTAAEEDSVMETLFTKMKTRRSARPPHALGPAGRL